MKLKYRIALVAICLAMSSDIHAQWGSMEQRWAEKHMRDLHKHFDELGEGKKARLMRYYVGISKPFVNFDINQHYTAPASDPNTVPPMAATDATVETKTSSTKSWGVYAGSFFPFFPTGETSAVGFDVSVNASVVGTRVGPINYAPSITDLYDDGSVMIINLPLAMCIKSGGEVTMSKRDKELFSFGAGVAPYFASTKLISTGAHIGLKKFIMAEIGAFTGLAWKIRAAYYPGSYTILNAKGDMLNSVTTYSGKGPVGSLDEDVTTANEFSVSLVLLPFSYKWSD